MDFHECAMEFDDFPRRAIPGHCDNDSDLENAAGTQGNLRG